MGRSKKKDFTHWIPIIKWTIRGILPIFELFLIAAIIWWVFNSDGVSKEMQNILSGAVGGLIVNYTKMSGFIFSSESDRESDGRPEK
jgi:hypothetical protein